MRGYNINVILKACLPMVVYADSEKEAINKVYKILDEKGYDYADIDDSEVEDTVCFGTFEI